MKQKKQSTVAAQRPAFFAGGKGRIRAALCLLLAAALLVPAGRYLFSEELETTFYHLYSPKVPGGASLRVVVLSDLHNRTYGPDNEELIGRIAALAPDLIAVAGDMVNGDDEDCSVLLKLCAGLVEVAPVYLSPGNHENHLMYEKGIPLEQQLTELGVHVLVNRAEEVEIHRIPLLIGGLNTAPEGYQTYGADFFREYEQSSRFKLLIAHYPSLYYQELAEGRVDLGICGHFHGGQARLPLIGGLYHGDTGLFPKYSGGMYRLPQSTILVSRGMGGHNRLGRFNNRPELAVIDINGRQEAEGSQLWEKGVTGR